MNPEIFGQVECPLCKTNKFFPVIRGYMKVRMCPDCNVVYKPVSKVDLGKNSKSALDMSKSKRKVHLRLKELA